MRPAEMKSLLGEAAAKWYGDNCLRLGASLAYYTLLSLFPLILVVLSLLRLVLTNSDAARDAILDALGQVTGGFRDDFLSALETVSRTRGTSGLIGGLLLLVGASWVFGELVSAFNIIWDVKSAGRGGPMEFLRLTFFSYALILAAAFLLLVSLVFSAALTLLGQFLATLPGGAGLWGAAQVALNLGFLTLVFAVLFKYLPRTHVAWRDVWPGAALTAAVWALAQLGISYYITLSSFKDYGAVGSTLALITWVYLSSLILFAGGEFTAAYARRHGSRAGRQQEES
jgi:membrane protein